ncbi:hypothetical protein MNEG_5334, partial [Monoraphidium neglectum]
MGPADEGGGYSDGGEDLHDVSDLGGAAAPHSPAPAALGAGDGAAGTGEGQPEKK